MNEWEQIFSSRCSAVVEGEPAVGSAVLGFELEFVSSLLFWANMGQSLHFGDLIFSYVESG